MRINRYIALATGLSRRAADDLLTQGTILINGQVAAPGTISRDTDVIVHNGRRLRLPTTVTIALHKPEGFVCSRQGQGSKTIYDLLPADLHSLKPVGRLDKDSSGLLLLTNDGQLAQKLMHPSFHKIKVYEIGLNKPLQPLHHQMVNDIGIQLEDGRSRLMLERLQNSNRRWRATMHEGRNRQIRRTFAALGYNVVRLHRTQFGKYHIGNIRPGEYVVLSKS